PVTRTTRSVLIGGSCLGERTQAILSTGACTPRSPDVLRGVRTHARGVGWKHREAHPPRPRCHLPAAVAAGRGEPPRAPLRPHDGHPHGVLPADGARA